MTEVEDASPGPATPAPRPAARPRKPLPPELTTGLGRQTAEFLVVLALCILIFRTFVAEAYVVPTGSMAPTLLGLHREVVCANCDFPFNLGMDEKGRSARAICPNCGQIAEEESGGELGGGDRLLVQKFHYDLRPPRRWEVAVFQSPTEGNQAYVKRVVGLPGDLLQIRDGDLWINGAIARKPLDVQRGMRVLLFDSNFPPRDSDRYPRLVFRAGGARRAVETHWRKLGERYVHDDVEKPSGATEWLEYRHWDPDAGRFGPIRDFYAYNGGDVRADNEVTDLMFEADLRCGSGAKEVVLRLNRRGDVWIVRLPVGREGGVVVQRNGRSIPLDDQAGMLRSSSSYVPVVQKLEVSVIDRRLTVALDGRPLFTPHDFEEEDRGPGPFATPIGIGVESGELEVSDFRVFRDIYYTNALGGPSRRPFGVDVPYLLGKDEYFVLGDNSPVSNDSRFWTESPVVKRSAFVGKPFVVHLPGRMFPLKVFGRPVCRIPDPREIRYIR